MRLLFFLIVLTAPFSPTYALDQVNKRLLSFAKACPVEQEASVPLLVRHLKSACKSESEMVELFSYWIADNIAYDTKSYQAGMITETSQILRTRKGTCQNYAELLEQMCRQAGIECHVIRGYTKGFSYRKGMVLNLPDHAWNAVRVDGTYKLVDATWASGSCSEKNGVLVFEKHLKVSEILADPDYFIVKHLPGDPRWQLLSKPVSIEGFSKGDSLAGMSRMAQPYSYLDSIAVYCKADSIDRNVMSMESAYRFHASTLNLQELGSAYYAKAYYYSMCFNDATHYRRSVDWYKKAIATYGRIDTAYAKHWTASARNGIEYSQYKLEKLKPSASKR